MRPPKAEPLSLPRGVRLVGPDEIPGGPRKTELLARVAAARLVTRYVATTQPADKGYTCFIEANVHAPILWDVFKNLANTLLPAIAAPLVGVKDEEPLLGRYTNRQDALEALAPFREALQHDGFLEFGLMFQQQGRTEEVFVRSAKYIQVWTRHPDRAAEVLAQHGIPAADILQFVDQFPHVSESLRDANGNAGWPPVIEALRLAFDGLPAPSVDA